jgi:DNA modification methylase
VKPYYQDEYATIYHGDCVELMSVMGEDSVELCLTDPPYGIGLEYDAYDDSRETLLKLIPHAMVEIQRVAKRALITPGVANIQDYPPYKWCLAWATNGSNTGSGPWGFSTWQPILAYGTDPYLEKGLGRRPDSIYNNPQRDKGIAHPCAKPEGLWKWILERGSVATTDLVFDPFMGSGTTLRVSKDCNRRCIGIDISEKYCEVAADRMAQEVFDFTKQREAAQ